MKIKGKSLLGQSQRKPGASFQSPLPEKSQGMLSIPPATNCNMVRDMLATRAAHGRPGLRVFIGTLCLVCTWTPRRKAGVQYKAHLFVQRVKI